MPKPEATGGQIVPPPLSPSMPVKRLCDVGLPLSQSSTNQLLSTANSNGVVLSTLVCDGEDERDMKI